MGRGATATLERLAASVGLLNEASPRFAAALDIAKGGVLLALPALMVSGLLRHASQYFRLPKGFYGLTSILLLLAFMALARLRSMEALRYYAPGEWGKLLGIDRAPEVRTLRIKLKHLAEQDQAFAWSARLCQEWMMEAPDQAAVLYVDGHVRVYHGKTKQLPKHYVARERLCLSATADYWVNAMDGKPFFVVSQPVDPGMLRAMDRDIVPVLEQDVPNQPSREQLEADPLLHRFTMVFDREGYSPGFLATMKHRRIACLTYHKYPGEDWPRGVRRHRSRLTLGPANYHPARRAGHPAQQPAMGARVPQAEPEWPPNRLPRHRLPRDGRRAGTGYVQPMVAGKLLPLHAAKLQSGRTGRLWR